MTTEVRERTGNNNPGNEHNDSRAYRSWLKCPRCIGGNMYHDNTGENCCIQCGYSYFPDKQSAVKMG